MFLSQTSEKVILQSSPKILKISTVFNGFVYITTCNDPSDVEKLIHIDNQGNILNEWKFQDSLDTFAMFNEREVIVMNVHESKIQVIDLCTNTIRSYDHKYAFPDTSYMDIYVFQDTKTFCIVERGSNTDNRLFLSYYNYDASDMKQVAVFQSGHDDWSSSNSLTKVNNHSKIAWWKAKQDETITFSTFDLAEDPSGKLQAFKINNTLAQGSKASKLALNILFMIETSAHMFLLICETFKQPIARGGYRRRSSSDEQDNNRHTDIKEDQPEREINTNFIVNAKQETIKESKLFFPGNWSQSLENFINLGQISIFHTFKYAEGQAQQSPVFYVHNEREEIIWSDTWKAKPAIKWYVPGFDSSMVIEASHEDSEVESVEVTVKRLMLPKDMYLHFLLHINQDFDDDLLQDAIALLED